MSNNVSLGGNYSLKYASNKPISVPTYGVAKKVGRFFVYTVPAMLALVTAKGGGNAMSPCWIAEAIYGPTDMRTHLVRAWLIGDFSKTSSGRAIVGIYRLVGRQTAWFVRRSNALKALFRPLFDKALERAIRELPAAKKLG